MQREYLYDHYYCQHCKRRFDAKKQGAKFCSPACRVASHRKQKKFVDDIQALEKLVQELEPRRRWIGQDEYKVIHRIIGRLMFIVDEYDFNRPL